MIAFRCGWLLALFALAAAPAQAQVELGVSAGGAGFFSIDGGASAPFTSVRAGTRVGSRVHLETVVDVMKGCPHVCVAYDVQVKFDLDRSMGATVFATVGGAGGITHTDASDYRTTYDHREYVTHVPARTEFIPPFLPVGGIGLEAPLSDHLLLRVDAQAYVFFVLPIAARASVGLSVPFRRR